MMLTRARCKLLKNGGVSGNGSFGLYSTEASLSLENQLLRIVDPRTSIVPILNQWVEEGRDVTQSVLTRLVIRLSRIHRFSHALQVSEWMSNERKCDLSLGDFANRIHLISKVRGVEQAERFFRDIPDDKLDFKVYAALLKCYTAHKSLEDAETIMKKIQKMRHVHESACYNMMLKLYAEMGKYEKLDRLMEEMIAKDICHAYSYNIRLNAYVAATDIKGMEKLLMQMEVDPTATVDWCIYTTAANGYLKVGNLEKAATMLKRSEHLARGKNRKLAYESLLTIYAAIGNKDEVYRLWNRCKSLYISYNSTYLSMLCSLWKLKDIEGAEKVLEEWESISTRFDYRIPNLMISAYCKCGQVHKAEAYIKRLLDSGKALGGYAWHSLASGYHMDNDMEKAVQTMKKAILAQRLGRRPSPLTLIACIKYLKENRNLDLALDILKLCVQQGTISLTYYNGLVSYLHSEMPDIEPLDLIKEDFDIGENAQLLDGEN
ncbi:hypothetical protein RJT34_28910 [Clitoria ternatea]|uniref:Pentatricopeptide repeat-containing protein n=1 Tax=Clitoria ternatea TaxID=43366 RepID=A0AAN9F9Z8_CLITE